MADNITTNPGTGGAVLATDDIGGVQFPRTKIVIGADGVNGGDVSGANPLPVTHGALLTTGSAAGATPVVGLVGGVRRDADTAPVADGQAHPFYFNTLGRLKVSSLPAALGATTGSITASGQQVAMECSRVSNVVVGMVATTLSGHNATFEASVNSTNGTDGNWYAVQAVRSNANTIESTTGALSATPAYLWELSVNGYNWIRVRATAHTAGTAAYTLQAGSFATEPVPAIATHPVTQSGTWNVTVNAAIAAGTNAIGDVGIQYRANATGAAGIVSALSPATPVAGTIKASAGRLIGWQLQNSSTGVRSVKIFNASAPTLGTTAAAFEIDIPAGSRSEIQLPGGIGFATAITWSVTSAKGLTDNTATGLAANDVSGSFFFA